VLVTHGCRLIGLQVLSEIREDRWVFGVPGNERLACSRVDSVLEEILRFGQVQRSVNKSSE
jgi:hypothetical protein